MTQEEVLERNDYKRVSSDPDGEDMWEDPAGHVVTFDLAVQMVYGTCKRCPKPCCYPGALFCGAGCSARWEDGDHGDAETEKESS